MNNVTMIGRLVADPDLRYTQSSIACSNFRIAVNRKYKDKDGENVADFHNVVVWRTQAENVKKYCSKGSQVCVTGELQNRSYDDKDGIKRYVSEIIADRVVFLDNKNNNNQEEAPVEEVPEDAPSDPFADFGNEVQLSDDDLPF